MSLALATKGIIAGIGFGSGTGEGGIYPDGYIASTISIDVDLDAETVLSVSYPDYTVDVDLNEEISVDLDSDDFGIEVSAQDESLEVDICNGGGN